jgi:hypothetical protein
MTMSPKDRTRRAAPGADKRGESRLAETKGLLPAAIVSLLGNVQLGGFANHHRDAFLEERTAVGIAQLDVVVTGSKREFLGLPSHIRVAAIDVNCSVLAVRIDLYVAEVRCHVVRRIRVREERIKNLDWLHDYDARPCPSRRRRRC